MYGWAVARDISLIILAVVSIVIGILLIILVFQIQRLVKMLQTEIKPILYSTNETVGTVRGTAEFVSEHLVTPIVRVNSIISGVRRGAEVIGTSVGRRRSSSAGAEQIEFE